MHISEVEQYRREKDDLMRNGYQPHAMFKSNMPMNDENDYSSRMPHEDHPKHEEHKGLYRI
jgi:hypothetical protein